MRAPGFILYCQRLTPAVAAFIWHLSPATAFRYRLYRAAYRRPRPISAAADDRLKMIPQITRLGCHSTGRFYEVLSWLEGLSLLFFHDA